MKALPACLAAALLAMISPAAAAPAKDQPVTIEQAEKELAKGAQLLDVRTEKEWNEGHLEGATRVSFADEDFVEKVKAGMDPAKPVVVYCAVGGRSARAAKLLREAGFKTVHDLGGGITAWRKAGKPVEK